VAFGGCGETNGVGILQKYWFAKARRFVAVDESGVQ